MLPFVVAQALLQGTLSAVALVALLVGLGRGISMLGVTLAGLGFAASQFVLSIAGVTAGTIHYGRIEPGRDWLIAIPLGLGLIALFAALLRPTLHHSALRTLIAVGLPPLATLSLLVVIPMLAPYWWVQTTSASTGLLEVISTAALSWTGAARWLLLWDPYVPQALASSYYGSGNELWLLIYLHGMGLLAGALMAIVSLGFCRASLQRRLRGG